MYAERQGRFFDITEHFTEKRRVAGVVVAQVHLCHVVAVRHWRFQRRMLRRQQCLHFAADHFHRGVIEHQVMEQQNCDCFAARRIVGMHQTHQGCLGQIQPVAAGVIPPLQAIND